MSSVFKMALKKPTTKATVIFLIGLLIGVIFSSSVYVYAQSGLSTVTISGGPAPGAPSYTIFTEGGTYYAKSANGAISWSSSNASYIFEQARTNAGTGTVLIKNGNYVVTNTLYWYKAGLVGESRNGAIIIVNADVDGMVINASATNEVLPPEFHSFTIRTLSSSYSHSLLTLNVTGVESSGFPMKAYNIDLATTSPLQTGIGLKVINSVASTGTSFHSFSGFTIYGVKTGIYLESNKTNSWISDFSFDNILLNYVSVGMYVNDTLGAGYGVHNNVFRDMRLQAYANTTDGAVFEGGKRNLIEELMVTDIGASAKSLTMNGTAGAGGGANVVLAGSLPQLGSITTGAATFSNVRYVTSANSGTANAINGTWVAHGLSFTPVAGEVKTWLNENPFSSGTAYVLNPVPIAYNSTHFQVLLYKSTSGVIAEVTVAKGICWSAEAQP